MTYSSTTLSLVFGPDSTGATPQERASTSKVQFVRSQTQLSFWNERAKAPRITATKALQIANFEGLCEVLEKGAFVLDVSRESMAADIKRRRENLSLKVTDVATAAGLSSASVNSAEDPSSITPIRDIQKIGQTVGIDLDELGQGESLHDAKRLGSRLRTLRDPKAEIRLSVPVVLALSEAAWIISMQRRLSALLGEAPSLASTLKPVGHVDEAPWKTGFRLAAQTRTLLALGADEPILSMRKLLDRLGIPLIQQELAGQFAGATLQNGDVRGIVVNLKGDNARPWVRRVTLAHELGHYLWDPASQLKGLHVDRYAELRNLKESRGDRYEARANAFAVALLAPPHAVLKLVEEDRPVVQQLSVMMTTFGIPASAAKYHLSNVSNGWGRALPTDKVRASDLPEECDQWRGSEDHTADFFPVQCVPIERRGHFAGLVARSALKGVITIDDAAIYLKTSPENLENQLVSISELNASGL